METAQQKVDRLQAELEALNNQSPRNEAAVNQTANALDEAKKELEQEQATQVKITQIQQAHEDRVTQSTDDFFNEIENLDISNGMTLRDVMIDESFYQSATISIKGLFQTGVDGLSQQIATLEGENSDLVSRLKKETEERQKAESEREQERLDHTQTQQYRTNLANLLEEAQKEIAQLQEQLKSATAGVKTTNTEEEQRKKAENDAKIKLERTIYNVIPDNPLFIKLYTVNLAATGESFTIPHYALKSYIVIQESEVSQFRADNGIAETTATSEDNAPVEQATETIQDSVTPEVPFPELPRAEAPEVPDVPAIGPVAEGQQSVEVPGQTVEERISALEQSNLDMQTWIDSIEKRVGKLDGGSQAVA
ncbi:hypothetical protein [Paenibacillus oryzisoli]|uniref:Uncharacterized protein n=1 Tax=Paenibacillus oryzisoli TaxID=1850517 RepID=A0A198ACN5_9BACL|nr:hypothetical protein [Paenibacillus oryzisoli]OAS19259.1 hypothetical protein A8708_26475 [Paenibacillus oryzisoli]